MLLLKRYAKGKKGIKCNPWITQWYPYLYFKERSFYTNRISERKIPILKALAPGELQKISQQNCFALQA